MNKTVASLRWLFRWLPATKKDTDKIMAKLTGLEGRLNAVNDKLTTIATEIQNLKTALTDVDIPEAAEAALEKLEAAAQADVDAGAPAAAPAPAAPTA